MAVPTDFSDKVEWRRRPIRLFLLFVVLAFLIPRLLLLAVASGSPIADGAWYFDRAISIVSGHGYTFDGKVTAFWPVGYPGFLAVLFFFLPKSPLTGFVANFFLSAASVICSYYLFRRLRVGTYLSFFGCLVLSVYPTFILYQQTLLSELLTAALVAAAILALLSSRTNFHYFFTGVIFGLATLVKSQILLILLIVPLYDVLAERAVRLYFARYLFLVFGLVLTVSPWTLRNFVEFDRFILVQSNGGYNLFVGNNPSNIYGSGINADQFAAMYPEVVSDITKPLPDEIGMNDRAGVAALRFMAENPVEMLRRVPHKLFRFFYHDALPFEWVSKSNARAGRRLTWLMPWFEISFWYHTVVVTLAMLSGWFFLIGPVRTKAHYLLLSVICSFAAISAIFFGSGRFAVPVLPEFVGCMLVSLHNLEIRFGRPIVRLILGSRAARRVSVSAVGRLPRTERRY